MATQRNGWAGMTEIKFTSKISKHEKGGVLK